jgi:hypothetical protein
MWNLSVADGKLQMQTPDGGRSLCERLTIVVTGVDLVEATITGQRIQLSSGKDAPGGTFLQASADRVTRTGQEGSIVGLEGNAKMVYARGGKKADISADRVSVNLMTGQIVIDMDAPPQPVLPGQRMVQPCAGTCPATPPVMPPVTSTSPSSLAVGESTTSR